MNVNTSASLHAILNQPTSSEGYSIHLFLAALSVPVHMILDAQDTYTEQLFRDQSHLDQPTLFALLQSLDHTHAHAISSCPADFHDQLYHWFEAHVTLMNSMGELRNAHLALQLDLSNHAQRMADATAQLNHIDQHLCLQTVLGQSWLLPTPHPTWADLMLFPLLALATEAGITLDAHLHVRRWIQRIRHLPFYFPMPGPLGGTLNTMAE